MERLVDYRAGTGLQSTSLMSWEDINCEIKSPAVFVENNIQTHWSLSISFNLVNPMYSANSTNNILMKIWLENNYMDAPMWKSNLV